MCNRRITSLKVPYLMVFDIALLKSMCIGVKINVASPIELSMKLKGLI